MILWTDEEKKYVENNLTKKNHIEIAEELEMQFGKGRSTSSVKNEYYKARKRLGIKSRKIKEDDEFLGVIMKYKAHRGEAAVKSKFTIYNLEKGKQYLVKTVINNSYSSGKSKIGHKRKVMTFLGKDDTNYHFMNELGWREAIRIYTPNSQFSIHVVNN